MSPRCKSQSHRTSQARHLCLCLSLLHRAVQLYGTMPSFLYAVNSTRTLPPTVLSLSAAEILSPAKEQSLLGAESILRMATEEVEHPQEAVASTSPEKTPNKLSMPLRHLITTNGDKELAAIRKKTSTPCPPTLRQALGRSRVDTSCRKIKRHIASLASYNETLASFKVKGTLRKPKPAQTIRQPKNSSPKRQEALKLRPKEICQLLVKTLMPKVHAAVEPLSLKLVEEVEKHCLLKGYSASAIAAGCIEFAASALQTTATFSKKQQKDLGVKWNVWSTKCAYNVLWWERKKFEKVLVARILSLRALKPPSGRDGKVAEWILKAD